MAAKRQTLHLAIVIAVIVCASSVITPTGLASEPSDMILIYDFQSQKLTVNVSHYVANTKTHYIETIEIYKNTISVLNKTYASQSENWGMSDTFNISAVVGDNLTVTATCNKGYAITSWLIVTSTITTNPTTSGTTSSTQTTTETTNTTVNQSIPLNTGPAIVASVTLIVFFVLFFLWLKPEYAPDVLKKLGSHLKDSLIWLGEKMRDLLSRLRSGLSELGNQIKEKLSS